MKKVVIAGLIIILLMTCTILYYFLSKYKVSEINIVTDTQSEIIAPGESISYAVHCLYNNKLGKEKEEEYIPQIDVDSSVTVLVNEGCVRVDEDALTGEEIKISVSYLSDDAQASESYSYIVKYSLQDSIDDNGVILDPTRTDVLVTKSRSLPKDYVPQDLVKVNVEFRQSNNTVKQMRSDAAEAVEELFAAAKKAGYVLYGVSGYRPYSMQNRIYNSYVSSKGLSYAQRISAQPGKSEHQTGLAMDISCSSITYLGQDFGDTAEGKWVAENAYKYGLIIRYPEGKENITGYMYEPWHLRYVGVTLAKKIYESGLTFDEYMLQ
jgi:LAS superfamily LD-carboxypeptidase LdcB